MKLKVDVKHVNSCEKVLTIDVPPEMVQEEFNSFYEVAGKWAKVPGFRPGHVPKHVVALYYRDEARQEVWKHLVSKTFRDALDQEAISIIGYPKIEHVEFDESRLKFKAHVETKPKIKIDKYVGLTVKRDRVQVSEPEVEEALKRIQQMHAKFQAVEGREAQIGDFLICDYRLQVDRKEIEKREGEWIEIREKDYLDGFSKQLIGTKSGATREVNIRFPSDYVKKELADKEGSFLVTVHEVKEKKLPPLDDELVKEVGEYETLEDLKKAIRRDIEEHKKVEVERKLERQLLDELMRHSKFDLPSGIVERRLNALVEEGIQTLVARGLSQEEALKQKEVLKKNFLSEAQKQVRISFLLDEIAQREQITTTEEDVLRRYGRLAERSGKPIDEVKAYFAKDEDRRESLMEQIRSEKTIEWLKEKAAVSETSETGEEGGRQ